MKPNELLKEVSDDDKKRLEKFITEKSHPEEIGAENDILILDTLKTSKFDKIMLERERRADPEDENDILQETAVIGLNVQDLGPDLTTFIGAWSPDGFKFELTLEQPGNQKVRKESPSMEMA